MQVCYRCPVFRGSLSFGQRTEIQFVHFVTTEFCGDFRDWKIECIFWWKMCLAIWSWNLSFWSIGIEFVHNFMTTEFCGDFRHWNIEHILWIDHKLCCFEALTIWSSKCKGNRPWVCDSEIELDFWTETVFRMEFESDFAVKIVISQRFEIRISCCFDTLFSEWIMAWN